MTICFVPFHPSHLRKNERLLRRLSAEGCKIVAICLDQLYPPPYSTHAGLEAAGYPCELLPSDGFRVDQRRLSQLFHSAQLTSSARALLQRQKPDIMIVGADSDLPGRALARAAKALAIPVVLMVDGLAVGRNPRFRLGVVRAIRASVAGWIWRGLGAGGPRGQRGRVGPEGCLPG